MEICVPVLESSGLDSPVSEHFGSAPVFMIVDTDSGACRAIVNGDQHHAHGMCQPIAALAGTKVEGVVVGDIGAGALMKLEAANIAVFRSEHRTVGETVAAWNAGTLSRVTPAGACAHHGHAHAGH